MTSKRWTLYVFVDPRDTTPIYVGITSDIRARLQSHMHGGKSAVYEWRKLNNIDPVMLLVAEFSTWDLARSAEERLIAIIPCLANRDVRVTRQRVLGGVASLHLVA